MKVIEGIQKYNASMDNYQQINDRFSTVSVKILYAGKNPNGTYFDRSLVESKLETLKNMPVVGEFSSENEDFKGHGGKLVVTDDKIDIVPTTRPYGLIPESFTHEWVAEDLGDGRVKDTLIVHGVILWTKHYSEAWKVISNNSSQSMEVEINQSKWDGELEAYKVEDFNFHALCILGDNVLPAFENSHFYSLQSFKDEFAEMLTEFKQYTLNKEEDILEDNLDNIDEPIVDPVEPVVDTELTEPIVDPEPTEPTEPTEPNEPVVEPDPADEPEDINPEPTDLDKYNAVVAELEVVKAELDLIKSEKAQFEITNKELAEFKENILRERHEDEFSQLLAKYKLANSDVSVDDIHKYSIDQLDEKLKVVIAEKVLQGTYSLTSEQEISPANKIAVEVYSKNNKNNPYGDLFEEFGSID